MVGEPAWATRPLSESVQKGSGTMLHKLTMHEIGKDPKSPMAHQTCAVLDPLQRFGKQFLFRIERETNNTLSPISKNLRKIWRTSETNRPHQSPPQERLSALAERERVVITLIIP